MQPSVAMAKISTSEESLRRLLKEVVAEAQDERRDQLQDILFEALEDLALGEAITQGRKTEIAPDARKR